MFILDNLESTEKHKGKINTTHSHTPRMANETIDPIPPALVCADRSWGDVLGLVHSLLSCYFAFSVEHVLMISSVL
jgi:hypothetical protein